jgi:hypothetical protein
MTATQRAWLLLLALLLPACRSAGPKGPPATAAPLPAALSSYQGALRVLPGRGDQKALTLKPGDVLAGGCDVAVHVRDVAFDKGSARFTLDTLGQPRVGERRTHCQALVPVIPLVLTGFAAGPLSPEASARVEAALMTPEEYLRRKGVSFDHPAAGPPSDVASQLPDASESERRFARTVVAWPRALLSVEALYHDPSGRGRHERLVAVEAVIGADGRAYRPVTKASIDPAHQKAIESALQLWRFEPARRADAALGARVALEVPLRVY